MSRSTKRALALGGAMKGRLLYLILVWLLAPDAGAQDVKLRVALQGPVTSPFYGVTLTRLKEEVERRSDGTLAIEIIDKGRLFGDSQMVDAVSSGAVEIGITASQIFVGRAPLPRLPRSAVPLQFSSLD